MEEATSNESKPGRLMCLHRLLQYSVRSKLDRDAAEAAFQRATMFVRTHIPDTERLRASLKEDLTQIDWVLNSAVTVARCYTELADMLPSTTEWVTLLLECAGCMARMQQWQEAKEMLAMATSALAKVDCSVPAGASGDVGHRLAAMQSFIDEWDSREL